LLAAALLALAGCNKDMADQPRYEVLERSNFFADGSAMRIPPAGTVARGMLRIDEHRYRGRVNGQLADTFPFPVEQALLERGRERYQIYCTPCHDQTGSGQGMVVRKGFPAPPSFHIDRLREVPVGHFFDVITHGFGRMYDYSAQLPPDDRWAVAAYIRVLQLSQNASADMLSPEDLQQLNSPPATQ
jgi:mono/diheme cytochrome c family protein